MSRSHAALVRGAASNRELFTYSSSAHPTRYLSPLENQDFANLAHDMHDLFFARRKVNRLAADGGDST